MDEELEKFILKSTKLGLSMVYAHQKTSRPVVHIQKEYERYKDKLPKQISDEAKQYYSISNICSLIDIFVRKYSGLH
jgi:hypothetical protein